MATPCPMSFLQCGKYQYCSYQCFAFSETLRGGPSIYKVGELASAFHGISLCGIAFFVWERPNPHWVAQVINFSIQSFKSSDLSCSLAKTDLSATYALLCTSRSASRSGTPKSTQGGRFEVSLPCRMRMIKNIDHPSYSVIHPYHHSYIMSISTQIGTFVLPIQKNESQVPRNRG